MQHLTAIMDKLAISLSFLCVAHCLLLPFAVIVLPVIGASFLEGEAFHYWLLFFSYTFECLQLMARMSKAWSA